MRNELDALGILSTFPQLGSISIRSLIKQFGSAQNVLEAGADVIRILPNFRNARAKSIDINECTNLWHINRELAEKHGAEIIPYTSKRYPKRLLDLHDHPLLIYVKGEVLPDDQQSIAVVGTRQATRYGIDMAEQISRDLAQSGFTVISGLARGIDTAAHQGALQTGRTVAVIGSGLANLYPPENSILATSIAENGALLSEFPMSTPPDRQNFPQRNRLVNALTLGTFLVEAPEKSGAMLTVELALDQKKKVFALPGRVDYDSFAGNHSLIKQGRAKLVVNAHDITCEFNDLFSCFGSSLPSNKVQGILLDPEESQFLSSLPRAECTVDEIIEISKLPVTKVNVLLMGLVLKRAIREFPGRIYKKVS